MWIHKWTPKIYIFKRDSTTCSIYDDSCRVIGKGIYMTT